MENKTDNSGSKSVKRLVQILETFSYDCPRQRVIDIASKLGATQSTISRYLSTLMTEGLLCRDDNTGYYYLSYRFMRYAGVVMTESQLYRYAFPEIQLLHQKLNLKTYLGILYDNRYMCIGNGGYQTPSDSFTPIGYTYPLHSTAIGKVILAYMPQKQMQEALQKDQLTPFRPNTITSIEKLNEALNVIRKKGYATIHDESLPGISSVAAPIFNSDRKLEGVISVSDHSDLIDLKHREEILARIVLESARNVSTKLGYYPLKL